MHSVSLLVAALVMLHRPCSRSRITASMLLARAAQDDTLSPAEREACQNLVDELELEPLPSQAEQAEVTHRPHHAGATAFNRLQAI
jgi:hypothetical protein